MRDEIILHTNDTTILVKGKHFNESMEKANLRNIRNWFQENKLESNTGKTVTMPFGTLPFLQHDLLIKINDTPLLISNITKFLSIHLSHDLKWPPCRNNLLPKLRLTIYLTLK